MPSTIRCGMPTRGLMRATLVAILLLGLQPVALTALAKPIDWDKDLKKGYYELSIGNVDKAINIFDGKLKKHPESGACHTALGIALKKKGKLSDARSEFRKATEVEPGFAEGYYELGAMLQNDNQYSGALQAFERYLQLKPDSDRRSSVADRIRFCKEHI